MSWIKTGTIGLVAGLLCQITNAANLTGIDFEQSTITLPLSQEPRTLNSLRAESVSYTAGLMIHLQEGLMRYDRRGRLAGGVAERWEVSADQLHFWLRKDAFWQNGEPVTAHDFIYAWQCLIHPATASPSANLASPIKNAAAILKGELPPESLGVDAPNDHELIVRLAHPCAWCLKLMTNSIFYPVNQAFYEKMGEAYGTTAEAHLSNGAYQIKVWQRGKQLRFSKSETYWRAEDVAISNLHFDYIGNDEKTALNLFRSGEIAATSLVRDTIPDALALGYRIRTYPTGHLFNIQFSHREGMLSVNKNLRKAIALAIDKEELVNQVVASPGTRRADSMFHDWLTIGDTKFIAERPPTKHEVNTSRAQEYMALAKAELGLEGPVKLALTINDSGLYRRIAVYLQHQLNKQLDIDVAIDPQITQIMVDKWRKGSSDMTLLTWPVDVDDPMDQISFLGNPDFRSTFQGLYAGDDMASLYFRNRNALALEERLNAVAAVQQFFEEEVTVMPLFESYGATVISPNLKGFVWQPVRGYADYRYSRIVPIESLKNPK